jgi:hypothetical protein
MNSAQCGFGQHAIAMAHSLKQLDQRTLLLEYNGLVGYRERTEAVTRAVERLKALGAQRLLVDFTHAVVVEEGTAERADFIAHAVTAWNIPDAAVAFISVPDAFAWPAELACKTRHLPARIFTSRDAAMEWLDHGTAPLPEGMA